MVHFNNEPGPEVPRGPRIEDIRVYRPSFIGMIGLVCVPFLIFGSHGVYGWVGSVLLGLWWFFLITLGCFWFMRFPKRLPVLAALGFLAWFVAVLVARA